MKNALVVEDNPINMELVVEILTANGFTVDEAVNGEEAVARVDKKAYDIVLMDIELPGMDGVEAARHIKSRHRSLPVIALTSYAMKGDRDRFLAAGFDDYISKPLDVSTFIDKINKSFHSNKPELP